MHSLAASPHASSRRPNGPPTSAAPIASRAAAAASSPRSSAPENASWSPSSTCGNCAPWTSSPTLGDVSRSSIGNVVREIRPLLAEDGLLPPPAATRYRTATELLAATNEQTNTPTS